MKGRHAWIMPLLVLSTGCQATKQPLLATLRNAHSPAQPHREDPPVAMEWSFSTAASECVATASGPPRTRALTVRVDRSARLAVAPGGGASRVAFSGPGGSWTLRVPPKKRDAAATLPANDSAVARLLALVEGGRLRLEGGARPATLLLPDAGISGRDWIGCARDRAREASQQG